MSLTTGYVLEASGILVIPTVTVGVAYRIISMNVDLS